MVDVSDGTIRITAPLDAPKAHLIDAANLAHKMAIKRAKAEATHRDMAGRAAVAELYARLGSVDRTTNVITYGDAKYDPILRDLVAAVRQFASARLGDEDLSGLATKTVRRWVKEQFRYASDADYDDFDPTYPPAPVPYWGATVKDSTRQK